MQLWFFLFKDGEYWGLATSTLANITHFYILKIVKGRAGLCMLRGRHWVCIHVTFFFLFKFTDEVRKATFTAFSLPLI